MLDLESLRAFGANVDEGMGRCLNNEQLYLRLVGKAVGSIGLDDLKKAVADGDMDKAFELCHAMKGVMGNLSLTPLYELSSEMTELLRAKKQADYHDYVARLEEYFNKLKEICG